MPTPSTPSKRSCTKFLVPLVNTPFQIDSTLTGRTALKHPILDSPFPQGSREVALGKKQRPSSFSLQAAQAAEDEDPMPSQEEEDNLFFPSSSSNALPAEGRANLLSARIIAAAKRSSPFRGLRDKFELLTSTAKAAGKLFCSAEHSPLTATNNNQQNHHNHHNNHHQNPPSETSEGEQEDLLFSSLHLPVPLTDKFRPWKTGSVNFLSAEYFSSFPDLSLPQDDSLVSGFGEEQLPQDYFESKYDIIDLLGHGSFANVFKISLRETQETFALKKSRNPYSGSMDRKRKLKEVQTMWILNGHPNVTNIIEAWEQDGFLFIVLELCENGTLSDFLRDCKAFTNEQIWFVAQQIANGLSRLHELDIVHLDLKPENILLTEDYTLKISDFGLSRRKQRHDDILPLDDDCEGDKIYMAPEVLQGKAEKCADIFSFGLILLELAANIQLPSQGESWQVLRRGDLSLVSFEASISPSIIQLIKAMVNPQPSERICIEKVLHFIQQQREADDDSFKH